MLPNERSQPDALSLDHLHNAALSGIQIICSIICRPVELILRYRHGTRYFPVPVTLLSSLMMMVLPLAVMLVTAVMGLIPFIGHSAPPIGMFDLGSFAKLYMLLSALHMIRLYRLMLRPHMELHSQYEGAALPFFLVIPWGRSFWVTRCLLEPIFIVLAAMVLEDLFLIQPSLAIYLRVAAFALATKNAVTWYRAWEHTRILLDNKAAADIVARLVEDKATPSELAEIHLVTFPQDLPPAMKAEAADSIARAYTATLDSTQRQPKGDSHETAH